MLGNNKIEITEEDHLNANQVHSKLKPYLESIVTLNELTLSRVILDEKTLQALCKFMSDTEKLVYFNFTATLLTPEGRTKLLDALAENKSLEKIYLSDCLLSSVDEASLLSLIVKHPKLKFIDISGHTLRSLQKVETTIQSSQSLEIIKGCKVSHKTQMFLDNNKRFAQLDSLLKRWRELLPASSIILRARKQTFYKIFEQAKAQNKNDKRVNQLLADFSLYLANQYQQLSDVENARKYYEKYIVCNPNNPKNQNHAHLELASLFYTSASALKDSLKQDDSITEEEDENKAESDSIAQQYLLVGYPHLIKAVKTAQSSMEKTATAELKKHYANYMAEEFIVTGEKLLDTNGGTQTSFQRKYVKL